ncbi:MAG: DoxX family protein [Candidatus Wildermuthbacteria bacterium]|nr:DoxX family protein [Candidatus Wildermuthbacteria bacterium]
MKFSENTILFLLRISLGWLFFYAGITKILNPNWTAAGYLNGAKTFPGFFHWLASADILPIVNFLNEWGLTVIGVSLILGLFVRASAVAGAALMMLYYLPILRLPYVGDHSLLIDEHVIYFFVLLYLGMKRAGRVLGLDGKIQSTLG